MARMLLTLALLLAANTHAHAANDGTHAFTSAAVLDRTPRRSTSHPALHLHAQNATRRSTSHPALHLHAQNATRPRLPATPPVDAQRHERMLVELFSALLQTDDITLLERDAQAMGVAYLDTNFSMCRPPMLLRQSIRDIMRRYDLAMLPIQRKWRVVPPNHTKPSQYTHD